MRILHTADWHLGRLFHGVQLTEDQAHVLAQLVDLARDAKPDVVVVAGDVYDRAVPPPEAVALLDDVLSRLVLDLQIPVILIAGNHDSPARLHFGARLLAGRRLYVMGNVVGVVEPLVLHDAWGAVHFYPIPYAEPASVRACLGSVEGAGDCPIADHDSAMRATLARIRAAHAPGTRSVVIAHAFVAGGSACESERQLSVGGAGTVGVDCFDGFHYAALGHLHGSQAMRDGAIRYCGSPLKYSFDEADHGKSVCMVEMDGNGVCTAEAVALTPRRDVRRVQGLMADLMNGLGDAAGCRNDYLEITLLDDGPVLDAMPRLRDVYPHVLNILRRDSRLPAADGGADRGDIRRLDDAALFQAFFKFAGGADLSPCQASAYAAVVQDMHQQERQA